VKFFFFTFSSSSSSQRAMLSFAVVLSAIATAPVQSSAAPVFCFFFFWPFLFSVFSLWTCTFSPELVTLFFFFSRRIFLKIVLSSVLLSGRLLLSPSAFHCIFPSLSLSLSLSRCGCLCLFSFSVSVFLVVLVTIVRVFSNISSSGLRFSEISSSACVEFGVKASFS
jgi:hypothetical protein